METKERQDKYAIMRLSHKGRKLLKLCAAETGETMIELVERIAALELKRVRSLGEVEDEKKIIPESLLWEVWERDEFSCNFCGARKYLTIDHIKPESLGGETTPGNLQTLCRSCKSKKGR